jgi:uncharacterized membrane protein
MLNDSLHSLFLAQVMGLYLVIVAIVMLTRAAYYRNLLTHVKTDSPTIVLAATLGLILGLCLVVVHNIWIWESEVLVTLVAWFLLIKSVLWLAFPEKMVNFTHKMYSGPGFYFAAIVAGVIGILLISHGFYLFQTHQIV